MIINELAVIDKKLNGFSLIELVIVVAVLAILSAIAIPSFSKIVRKGRQSAAMAFVNQILTSSAVFHVENGRLPTSWTDLSQSSQPIDSTTLVSCSQYNSRCSGNQTMFLNGEYLIEFYTRDNEIRVSVWNPTPEHKNHHVWGCYNINNGSNIHTWNTEKYFQGPAWGNENTRITGDNGERLSMCGQIGGVGE